MGLTRLSPRMMTKDNKEEKKKGPIERQSHAYVGEKHAQTFTKNFHHTAINMVHVIKNSEDYKNAIKNKVNIIDCHATWCSDPCKLISPHFERLSREVKGVEFFKMDVNGVPDITAQLGIRAMPTFLFFKDGVKVNGFVGANWRGLEKPKAGGEASSSSVTSQ
ncbi:thioredoxin-like protein [Tuber magnatum]|uniref:Thioredoxin-like protein n=1 Tax=Tuber magnatum TaxID=42249 RepID=A0A317SKZ8_9PEZI|nr:thioredoxin-like protein [Tuber magnatum]